jgi:hypothetical protein
MELEDTPFFFFLPFWPLRGERDAGCAKKGLMDMLVRELKEEL